MLGGILLRDSRMGVYTLSTALVLCLLTVENRCGISSLMFFSLVETPSDLAWHTKRTGKPWVSLCF